jgi:hypothetical protein
MVGRQGFSKKYYPTTEGGDFFENPQGLTLPDGVRWHEQASLTLLDLLFLVLTGKAVA